MLRATGQAQLINLKVCCKSNSSMMDPARQLSNSCAFFQSCCYEQRLCPAEVVISGKCSVPWPQMTGKGARRSLCWTESQTSAIYTTFLTEKELFIHSRRSHAIVQNQHVPEFHTLQHLQLPQPLQPL